MGSGSSNHGASQQPQQQQQPQAAPVQYAQAPPQYAQQQQQQQNPCFDYNQQLIACMKDNSGNISMCQFNMDMLAQCEKDNMRIGY